MPAKANNSWAFSWVRKNNVKNPPGNQLDSWTVTDNNITLIYKKPKAFQQAAQREIQAFLDLTGMVCLGTTRSWGETPSDGVAYLMRKEKDDGRYAGSCREIPSPVVIQARDKI